MATLEPRTSEDCCSGGDIPRALRPNSADSRTALRLEVVTLVWMILEAAVSIVAGVMARSLLLVAFGADSVIELASAVLVLYRLAAERGERSQEAVEALDRRVSLAAACLLYALALYVVIMAGVRLFSRVAAAESVPGLLVAGVAALGMPFLARAKLRVAQQIGSLALRADAIESLTCGYMAWVLLGGLLLNAWFHWWWVDGIASLVIVPLLLREAREARTGECCCG